MKKITLLISFLITCILLSAQVNVDSLYKEYENARSSKKAEIAKSLISFFEEEEYIEGLAASTDKEVNAVKIYIGMSAFKIDEGEFQKGLDFGLQAEQSISPKWENANTLFAELYGNLCTAQFRLGKYDEAFNYAQKQYDFANKIHDNQRISGALNNIAFIFLVTNRGNDAVKYIDKAIAIERADKDSKCLAMRLGTKSEILLSQGKIQEAFDCINEAIELERQKGNTEKVGVRLSQKADVLIALGQFEDARSIYFECIDIFKQTNNPMSLAITLKQIGIAEMYLKDYDGAEKHLLEGMELCQKIGAKQLLYNIYMCLHNLFCLTNETKRALFYCEQYALLYDTLMTEEHQQQLSEFEVKYDTQEKEKQLLEQQLKNTRQNWVIVALAFVLLVAVIFSIIFINVSKERKRRNEELEKLNETKNRLFSIISHDLKNSVFSQKRMLDLLNEHFDSFKTEEIKESVSQLKANNDSLNTLLVNLLQWASVDGERIVYTPIRMELKQLVDNVVTSLTESLKAKNISISHNIETEIFVNEDARFIEFILRNLISNAIKFSHPDTEIQLKLEDQNNKYTLSVIDHGVGMRKEQMDMLFKIGMVSSKGTANEIGNGLGLMVCKEIMDKSGGAIWAESKEKEGTTLIFTLNK